MNEYISREEAIKELREVYENEYPTASGDFDEYASHDMPNILRNIPAADVQPVKHGKWEQDEKGAFHHCSECESKTFRDVDGWGYEYQEYLTDYCFHCGARMDGSSEYKPKDGDTK